MKPTVSVVVPIYNSEKYIKKCVKSIINQTYKNYEIILINDGSTDNSQKIIEELKINNGDIIKIKNQENKGVSQTRNEAINSCSGEYIMFIDNDDYIDRDYIEKYVKEIEKNDYDIVIAGFRRTNQEEKTIYEISLQNQEWSPFMCMAPWAKLYKKEYLIKNDIKFLKNNIGEDIYFNLQAYLLTDKIKTIDYVGYNWFFNNESVSNTKQKDITKIDVYNLLNSSYDKLKEKNVVSKNYEILELYYMSFIIWYLEYTTRKTDFSVMSKEYDKIFDWLKERFPNYKKNKLIGISKPYGERLKVKLMFLIFMISHKLGLGKILVFIYSRIK